MLDWFSDGYGSIIRLSRNEMQSFDPFIDRSKCWMQVDLDILDLVDYDFTRLISQQVCESKQCSTAES